ncbi:MAG: MmgE/PrpD family protein, partial [Clostridia bacterium]|nr:MmgE/PrpD family protein [Clostridia bacterium]
GALVIGHNRRASLQNAALCNAMSMHVLEMDDVHRFSTVHLSATVVPALLAVGEYYDLTMDDLIRGMIVGYEAGIRMGRCVQPAHRARGFHSSGTVGTLGAAMAVAAALKFTREEMKCALSAAATCAAGLNEMMQDVSTMKPFNPARACHDGVTCALIGRSGFVPPYDTISGTFSFLLAMCEKSDPSGLTLAGDPDYNITGGYHKTHAACRHTHAPVDGALGALRQAGLSAADVERVEVEMYGQGIKGHDLTDINTPGEGKMSVPFCVALALVRGIAGITGFTQENVDDPEIRRLCRATTVREDPEMTAMVPKRRPARVTLVTKDGKRVTFDVPYAVGEPENPMSLDDFKAKFVDLASYGGKTKEQAARLADFVLTHSGAVADFIAAL